MTVSVREVAELAGVSIGTVSNVINRPEKVAEATAERVQRAITELGYVRNDSARQLRLGRSTTVGMIVLDVGNPFFAELARGAEDAALEHGLAVILGNSNHSSSRERTYVELFSERRVAGMLISPTSDDLSALEPLADQGTTVVLVDQSPTNRRFSSVSVDDVYGGRLAGQHLLDTGRRRLVYVGGPSSIPQVRDRLEGFQRAVADSGVAALVEPIEGDELTVLEGRRIGELLASRSKGQRPDAVFAANDLLAIGLEQAFLMSGTIRVPEDIAIVGYDDIAFAQSAIVPLTSVRQPAYELGYQSVKTLARQFDSLNDEPIQLQFLPELVTRRSTEQA
ncbi:LacI family transcriptional regulator [Curtobacterium flaccumfaciens pv. beticola]|uniref:LacI family DNA-binding transcriptional regulator n=1 Tax=Curtobacterium TaxID=2034 RepID=UPI0011A55C79|nr:LacI family DNA-binding transcriptional regulator [Curtobacterium sp. BH-2-1-1]MCS5485567.1 LacI family transcriptional regulator [Curtobacterium flaccumfaciens pv. basellae]